MTPMYRIFTAVFLLIVLQVPQSVCAVGLSDDLLRIHANLLPKTMLMDYHFGQKLGKNGIIIDLVCKENNQYYARKLKQYILDKYPNGIRNIPIEVRIVQYGTLTDKLREPASMYYFLSAAPQQIRQALQNIPAQRLVFVYDPQYLQYGADIGLHVGRRITPVINVDALKKNNITLRPALVRISDLYYQNKTVDESTN